MRWLAVFAILFWAAMATGQTACTFPTLCGSTSLSVVTYPLTAPNIGGLTGAGTIFVDPVFGLTEVRVTDSVVTDPSAATKSSNTFGASLSGSDDESAWSSDDRLFFICSNGGQCKLHSLNPATLAIDAPYKSVTSGCPSPRSNCSTYAGFWFGTAFWSNTDPCRLYILNGTLLQHYEFGSDVSPVNSCSNGISGPPALTTDFNFIENSPTGCTGTACSCLPSDFGTPTWTGNAGTGGNDIVFGANYASSAYNDGGGTSQNHGVYAVAYVPGKGCTSYNTMTNAILADPGFTGGTGLTCSATQCTGTATAPGTYNIHSGKINQSGTLDFVNLSTNLSGTAAPSDSLVWTPGTTSVYLAEAGSHATGHGCFGSVGMWNAPGGPLNSWYYRTTPTGTGPSGTATQVNSNPSPNTQQFDSHCNPATGGASDLLPIGFQTTTNSKSSTGCCVLPLDQASLTVPWENELDMLTHDGSGTVYREAFTYSTGFIAADFDAQNTITNCSSDGLFCLYGTNWYNSLGNIGGTSLTCTASGPAWLSGKVYPANYPITPTSAHNNTLGNSFMVTTPGTASGVEPNWDTSCTVTCTDGGVTWTNEGDANGANACRSDVILAVFMNQLLSIPSRRTSMMMGE